MVSVIIGVFIGFLCAVWKNSLFDKFSLVFAVFGMSIPSFFSSISISQENIINSSYFEGFEIGNLGSPFSSYFPNFQKNNLNYSYSSSFFFFSYSWLYLPLSFLVRPLVSFSVNILSSDF